MSPLQKKAEESVDTASLQADRQLLDAVLDVYRQFELSAQLQVLLDHAQAWTAGCCGFGLGPSEETDAVSPIASSFPAGDPRGAAVRAIGRRELGRLLAGEGRVFEGLGPFTPFADPWPEAPPATSVAFPLPVGRSDPAAALWILVPQGRLVPEVLQRLERAVDSIGPAIDNGLRVRSMRELVIKDDMAHCFNRRYFDTNLPEELSRASRFHAPLSLIFLDMDNLKEVNTRHGHAMGSETLREVSRRILVKIRRFDKLFRFGGDEFCIVLPETEWHGALEVAERVRDAIAGKPFLVRELGDPKGIRMTASLGISSFPLHARTREELIQRADRAMQGIKSGTKNSIGIAEIIGDDHGR